MVLLAGFAVVINEQRRSVHLCLSINRAVAIKRGDAIRFGYCRGDDD